MKRHPIPDAALQQHTAILGKTGSGKTSTAKLLVEQVVADGARVCILDTIKSDWWGLTSSSDGKRDGLPFHILGGPKGHVPLASSAGSAVADIVASGALPLSIIDMADFEPGGVQRFFSDFAPTLLKQMTGVIYLVIEEAHELAPKERAGFNAENMSIHWAKKLATAGRSRGIRLVVCTQRTQSLHNAVLGSCETVIVHRLTTPADQRPVLDWLKANSPSKGILDDVTSSISSLKTGTAWMCSGEANIFERVTFPRITTYDNSATPTGNGGGHNVKMAAVDLDMLRAIVGDAMAEAEANDPKTLRSKVAELEKALAGKGKVKADGSPDAIAKARHEGVEVGKKLGWNEAEAQAVEVVGRMREEVDKIFAEWLSEMGARPAPKANGVQPVVQKAPAAKASLIAPVSGLSGPETKMLASLAWWAGMGQYTPSRAMVGAVCGWRVTSGHMKNVAGSLSSKGLIEYPSQGRIRATKAGLDAAPAAPDGELHDMLRNILTGPQRAAFDQLVAAGGACSRDELCDRVGWNPTSGHPKNVLGSMSSMEIITYPKPGHVALVDWLKE